MICSMNNSERFCEVLMSYSGALRSLADPGKNVSAMMNWMVFVPDDDAFQVIDETIGLTDDEVNRILVFYFYKNIMLSYDELVCGETLTSQSENDESRSKCDKNPGGNGNDETVVKYQNGNGNTKHGSLPKITTNDIMACNGIIHAIDHVMFPVMLEELEQQSYGNTTGKIEVKVFGW
ncbi:MAG: hypothetical protein ACI90V_006498 [Bacillariaceae sp.]|jgi:hypothetical protein